MRLWFKPMQKKENKNSPYQIQDSVTILKNPGYASLIQQIKALTSISSHQFQHFYLQPLLVLTSAAQALPAYEAGPYQKMGGFLEQTLQRTVFALKKRQSYLLPPGGEVEEQYQEQDIWTYATYLASLLKDCELVIAGFILFDEQENRIYMPWQQPVLGITYRFQQVELPELSERIALRLMLIGHWLPKKAHHWLNRFPRVKADWLKAVMESTSTSIIANILMSIQNTVKAQPTLETPINNPFQEIPAVKNSTNPLDQSTEPLAADNTFLSWLNNYLMTPDYPINTLEGGIFHLEEGCLIVYPTLLEMFLKTQSNPLKVKDLCQQIQSLPVALAQTLQRYCVGDWQTRTTVTGLLLKAEAVFKAAPLPPVYDHAYKDE